MRYIFFIFFVTIQGLSLAQYTGVSNNPFLIQTTLKQTIAYHIPNQETLIQLTQDRTVAYQFIGSTESELALHSQVKKLRGSIIAFGQEQFFDSDKKDSLTPAERSLIDSILQPSIQNIKSGKRVIANKISSLSFEPEDYQKFFLPAKYSKAGTAFSWTDSIQVDSSTAVYECTFLRKYGDTIQVHVFGTHQIKNSVKQGEQVIQQIIKGLERSMRYYDSKTGILRKEQRLIQFEGTAESQNTRFPVSVKLEVTLLGQ
jgi:hypothetical protein